MLVPTGIAMGIPTGYCVKIFGRSSMHKKGVIVQTGIVDSDYSNGEIKIQTTNFGNTLPVKINAGDRIAQFMLVKLEPSDLELVEKLRETTRGGNGFGSTGV